MGDQKVPSGRHHGVPAGRTERVERMTRTIYPDGTMVDSEPATGKPVALTWAALSGMFSAASEPKGTLHQVFTRTVVTEASEWTEFVPEDTEETKCADHQ